MSASYATWAEASRAFQNRNMHWRLSIQTHGPVEDISDLIHIMVRSGSISISALMRSLGTRLCMKPLSSRWLSASNFFKEAADSLCLYHWKLLYRDFEKIHWPPPTNQLVNLTVFRSLASAEIEISCVSGHTLDPNMSSEQEERQMEKRAKWGIYPQSKTPWVLTVTRN